MIEIAEKMISGDIGISEGSEILASLGEETTGDYLHSDFAPFVGISGDLCHFPVGSVRSRWSEAGLARVDAEKREIEDRYRKLALESCAILIEKYGSKDT